MLYTFEPLAGMHKPQPPTNKTFNHIS